MLLMVMTTAKMVVMGNHENPCLKKIRWVRPSYFGSSATGVEAKKAESEKKSVECFLCHGLYRLRKCLRKSFIEGNDRADKKPNKLGSSKGKAEAMRAKRSKKKRVKCFL
ncbi:hypothetical protein Goshw_026374 [Gossypium schwendimanii]|uniref:Uncharacterized protein n=1 Tax=Gossypium schwendimanii TaxID=34291 RepID=A0A7J9N8B6_GOSSC|nr:hypothetical protein [Gossypium schwendimanii]